MLASLNSPAEAGERLSARAALLDGTHREVERDGRPSSRVRIEAARAGRPFT
ncbi:hypothetical protein ABZY03_23765 [Streptomyces klenkii]|uniref:hypothetical protein n=1 Tax=Streptomyces klenkii TaxID=1420899 RepID=UPI0033B56604